MRLDRRRFLVNLGATAAGLSLPGVWTRGGPMKPLDGHKLYSDLVRYCDFGDHRTATPVDHQTSEWLAAELKAAGFSVRMEPWTHQQFFIEQHGLWVGGQQVDAFPLWWPAATGPEAITAPLVDLDSEDAGKRLRGRVALASIPPVRGASVLAGNGVPELVMTAAAGRAQALVIVTEHPTGEIVALNAMAGLRQWPIPVLLAGQGHQASLRRAANAGESASVLIDGKLDYAARAFEVVATLERGQPHMMVSTPSSGWFQCAGERGGGIALWLGLARHGGARGAQLRVLRDFVGLRIASRRHGHLWRSPESPKSPAGFLGSFRRRRRRKPPVGRGIASPPHRLPHLRLAHDRFSSRFLRRTLPSLPSRLPPRGRSRDGKARAIASKASAFSRS